MNTILRKQPGWILAGLALASAIQTFSIHAAESGFTFTQEPGRIVIGHLGNPVVTYIFQDRTIRRPYFANLHAPGGIQVTRRHPPVKGQDAMDHDSMHPGLWLAFGDINGQDFWRNQASIRHERFVEPPVVRDGTLSFAAQNALQSAEGDLLGTQVSRMTLSLLPAGYLLVWEAVFRSGQGDLVFGDQEEMGLGIRVATPITEKNGGLISSSTGAQTAKGTWGKAFAWCDYSGILDKRQGGVTVMTDPQNFRPSWWHNRDYGLMVANPFGRNAMGQGETSRVTVRKGERLRLRFGVLLHASPADDPVNLDEAYQQFVERTSTSGGPG